MSEQPSRSGCLAAIVVAIVIDAITVAIILGIVLLLTRTTRAGGGLEEPPAQAQAQLDAEALPWTSPAAITAYSVFAAAAIGAASTVIAARSRNAEDAAPRSTRQRRP